MLESVLESSTQDIPESVLNSVTQDATKDVPESATNAESFKTPVKPKLKTKLKTKKRKHQPSNLLHKKHSEDATRSHKFRAGTVALRQIKFLQKSTRYQIPRQAMKRVVRDILQGENPNMRLKRNALETLQTMCEDYVVNVFENAQLFALHSKRLGVRKRDFDLALLFRREAELKGVF